MTPRDDLAEKIAEIEMRQDAVLAELERLERRIVQVIAESMPVIQMPLTQANIPMQKRPKRWTARPSAVEP